MSDPLAASSGDPLSGLLREQGFVILDGGQATALEARGHDLSGGLWSARLLLEDPDEIEAVHLAWFRSGADCTITASYQASLPGLRAAGLSQAEAAEVLIRATDAARAARRRFLEEGGGGQGRASPLVAASVGPYGAYLADGSEYDGRYGVEQGALRDFHAPRLEILAESGCDLLACETLPSAEEAEVLLGLLDETPGVPAWMSFSCRDADCLWDGTPFREVVAMCAGHPRVVAVGVNCTAPRHVGGLLRSARGVAAALPRLAYPNSGETYDAGTGQWSEPSDASPTHDSNDGSSGASAGALRMGWLAGVRDAWDAGARIVGGCCRTGPDDIRELRARVEGGDWAR